MPTSYGKTEATKKCGRHIYLQIKVNDENSFITFCKMEDVIILLIKKSVKI